MMANICAMFAKRLADNLGSLMQYSAENVKWMSVKNAMKTL